MKAKWWLLMVVFLAGGIYTADVIAGTEAKDSVIVVFDQKTRLVIYGADRNEIRQLSKYDFNRLITDIAGRMDTVAYTDGAAREWIDGKMYLKASDQGGADRETSRKVRINLNGVQLSGEGTIVRVISKKEGDTEEVVEEEVIELKNPRRITRRSPRQGIDFKLGLNLYGKKSGRGYDASEYDLRTGGSRYVSVGIVRSLSLAKREKAGVFLDFGLDASWYNLMFEGDQVIRKETDKVTFPVLVDDRNNQEIAMKKSKLVAPYVNLSLMPTVCFAGSVLSHVSAGAYGGYRLGGYHKSKTASNHKEKRKSDFFMDDFRFGAGFELGVRNFPDFFVNYDINGLFEEGRGPHVRMLSFGIRW